MITASQLIAHAVGDYVLQTDWMASEKTKKSTAAAVHVLTYVLPFLFLTTSIPALTVIMLTHFAIDRWRLARYVIWIRNFLQPKRQLGWEYVCFRAVHGRGLCVPSSADFAEQPAKEIAVCPVCKDDRMPRSYRARNYPWRNCSSTGYYEGRPAWLATWLMIIVDNVLHVLCNAIALQYL